MNASYTKDEVERIKVERRRLHEEEYPNEQESDTEPSWHLWGTDAEGWEIWINPSKEQFTGMCVGHGKTKQDAIENCVGALHEAIHQLRRML